MVSTELQELEILVSVVKHGSFSKAAAELALSSSVVSRAIKKLEIKLKVKIFNRTTRKISLTQEGGWLYRQALEIIDKVVSVENHLSLAQTLAQGSLTVDAATPFTLHAIAPLIPGFKKRFNNITIRLTSSESIVDLIERNVDLAIRLGDLADSSLRSRHLGNSYRKVFASPDYLAAHGEPATADELLKHTCLGFLKPEALNTWPVVSQGAESIKVRPDIIADNGETLRRLAIEGCGIACISSFIADQDVRDKRLVCVLEKDTRLVPVPVHAVFYAGNEANLRVRSFLDYLVEHINLG